MADAHTDTYTEIDDANAEIRRLRAELAGWKRTYAALFENGGDSIFVIDAAQYHIVEANQHAARRLGYQPNELVGIAISEIEVIPSEQDAPAFNLSWESEFSNTRVYECHYQHKDGSLLPVEVSSRITQLKGRAVILNSVRHIEARKELREREFELALQRERFNLLKSFIQNASHEFRTPLSIISNGSYLIQRSDDAAYRQAKDEVIQEQITRITHLVDMLLLMATIESGDLTTAHPIYLQSLMNGLEYYRSTKYPAEPALAYAVAPDLPPIMGNPIYFQIALEQIIDNAYRFTPPGSFVALRAWRAGERLMLEIHDTGKGIDFETLPHIFEAFWRNDTAHTTPGFGLGLTLAQRVMAQLGGEINIDSPANEGTTVRVALPVYVSVTGDSDER